jgi:hypothetical protein
MNEGKAHIVSSLLERHEVSVEYFSCRGVYLLQIHEFFSLD